MSGILFFPMVFAILEAAACLRLDPVIVRDKSTNTCPSAVEEARANASRQILNILGGLTDVPECGKGKWFQVANLNMSDPQQECPSSWSVASSPGRSCVAPASSPCDSAVFHHSSGLPYQWVCGRARGFASFTPDAFYRGSLGINGLYLDGVSITHGHPRQHIWSFGAGHGVIPGANHRCPCDNNNRNFARLPPSFVGNNYFCDGEYNGALWDGKDCTTNCCTFNNPPWFTVKLTSTTDDIEVRICHDQVVGDERVYLNTLLLYVQ